MDVDAYVEKAIREGRNPYSDEYPKGAQTSDLPGHKKHGKQQKRKGNPSSPVECKRDQESSACYEILAARTQLAAIQMPLDLLESLLTDLLEQADDESAEFVTYTARTRVGDMRQLLRMAGNHDDPVEFSLIVEHLDTICEELVTTEPLNMHRGYRSLIERISWIVTIEYLAL